MDASAAKLIGAGIACIGMGGAGIGVGLIFGNYLSGFLGVFWERMPHEVFFLLLTGLGFGAGSPLKYLGGRWSG